MQSEGVSIKRVRTESIIIIGQTSCYWGGADDSDIDDMKAVVHHNFGDVVRDYKGNGPRLQR